MSTRPAEAHFSLVGNDDPPSTPSETNPWLAFSLLPAAADVVASRDTEREDSRHQNIVTRLLPYVEADGKTHHITETSYGDLIKTYVYEGHTARYRGYPSDARPPSTADLQTDLEGLRATTNLSIAADAEGFYRQCDQIKQRTLLLTAYADRGKKQVGLDWTDWVAADVHHRSKVGTGTCSFFCPGYASGQTVPSASPGDSLPDHLCIERTSGGHIDKLESAVKKECDFTDRRARAAASREAGFIADWYAMAKPSQPR
jgi:hypothetical protein